MAVLGEIARQQVWRALNRYLSSRAVGVLGAGITKSELRAAVDAADSWVDANAASFNSALPVTFRTSATVGQKALLLALVVLARYNTEALKALVGEVD